MQLSKLIVYTVLIILNHILFTNCDTIGKSLYPLFTGDKLYFFESQKFDFFYVDLTNVSLDTDTVNKSKWIDLTEVKPQPDTLVTKPLSANNNLILLDSTDSEVNAYTFNTTLNQWETIPNKVTKKEEFIFFDNWVSDGKTGISYSFNSISDGMAIFDPINLILTKGVSTPQNLFAEGFVLDDFVQVLLNGQVLFIGGGFLSLKYSMSSILTYETTTDTWKMTNTVGETPEGRIQHTAVPTSDGRIIVFGGISNSLPASPQLSILDTSKTPYEWSTPTVESPFGPFTFSKHTAVMVENYMIIAFGDNTTDTTPTWFDNNNNMYKLDVRDPLKYKWSFFSDFNSSDDKSLVPDIFTQTNSSNSNSSNSNSTNSTIQTSIVDSESKLGSRNAVIIVFSLIVFICISILVFYKAKQNRNMIKSKNTYQQNISSSENISSTEELENSMT
ncbi:hypothetical protein GLOIN_2v1773280 [Rhizophagus clarus]|uniref:Galactose oxidase n=1 Tax=Rhizophagus clarus TaxID=94130 RepID=A0A8H3QZE4_9GLOM|nr:hypothetical protein GLOIN_2v1773280 [Rhizophagus clarus]